MNPSLSNRRGPAAGFVVGGMLVYLLAGFVLSSLVNVLPLVLLATTVAYILAMYLFYGISCLAFRGQNKTLWLGGAATLAVSLLAVGWKDGFLISGSWAMLVITSAAAGYGARSGYSGLKIYLIGLAVIIFFNLVMFVPHWPEMIKMMTAKTEKPLADFKAYLISGGFNSSRADDYVFRLKRMMDLVFRLIPAAMIMGTVTQFSIGLMIFFSRGVDSFISDRLLPAFHFWKMPFWFVTVVIVSVLMRVLGGDTLQIIADNLLFVLAIYYCVTGLALGEYVIRRLRMSTLMRVLYYIMLLISSIYGFIIFALLGFIDSFKDWRRTGVVHVS
ncbi:MAG: DUF2232 domain-containing protein [Candidatus Zixiibacteriota bacterium]